MTQGNNIFQTQLDRYTYELTETVTIHSRPVQWEARQIPALRSGKKTQGSTLTMKLFAIGLHWKRRANFLQKSVTVYINYLPWQTPCPKIVR